MIFTTGKAMVLSEETEECAGFYARMLDHDYTTKDVFNNNFFKDWRKVGYFPLVLYFVFVLLIIKTSFS